MNVVCWLTNSRKGPQSATASQDRAHNASEMSLVTTVSDIHRLKPFTTGPSQCFTRKPFSVIVGGGAKVDRFGCHVDLD